MKRKLILPGHICNPCSGGNKIEGTCVYYTGADTDCVPTNSNLNDIVRLLCDAIASGGGGEDPYDDEDAQDAIGNNWIDTDTTNFTYTDGTHQFKIDVIHQMSITSDNNGLKLVGDSNSLDTDQYYGTDSTGILGYHDLPDIWLKNGYQVLFDGTNTASATGGDTITFRSGNDLLNITVGSNDLTFGDNVLFEISSAEMKSLFSGGTGISYDPETGVISSTIDQYTDIDARDAVGSFLTETDSISWTFNNIGTPFIEADIKDEYIFDLLKVIEISFTVGDIDAPQATDTTFILTDCSGNPVTNKRVVFYRERLRQIIKNGRDFTYNPSTGQITITVPFNDGEDCVFECYPTELFEECSSVPPSSGGSSMLINSTDTLLINSTDDLII